MSLSGCQGGHQLDEPDEIPLADRGDLLGQILDPRATRCALAGIAPVQTLQVIVKLGVGGTDPAAYDLCAQRGGFCGEVS